MTEEQREELIHIFAETLAGADLKTKALFRAFEVAVRDGRSEAGEILRDTRSGAAVMRGFSK